MYSHLATDPDIDVRKRKVVVFYYLWYETEHSLYSVATVTI